MMKKINTKVMMSGADYFSDEFAINAYMDDQVPVDVDRARREHADIKLCFEQAGIEVTTVGAPEGCQDGVYSANWALTRGNKALMANLPNKRQNETPFAEQKLREQGFEIVYLPREYKFSGQGDALPCGKYLFTGSQYRTDQEVHPLIENELGYEVISLQTVSHYDKSMQPIINKVTGWPDSFFYDIDLALAVIKPDLIAWCPKAFMPESQEKILALGDIRKIEVSLEEAMNGFACNLVSTGESVIMSNHAPKLQAALQVEGLQIYAPEVTELLKGGGFIRCTSLTLNNE